MKNRQIHPHIVDIAIIGGGITGLATLHYLRSLSTRANKRLDVVVLESAERAGGKILTEEIPISTGDRFLVEAGPDSFLTQKPWAWQLATELGLQEKLLSTNDHMRKVYVLNRGELRSLPDGFQLIVPTRFRPFALSPLLSPLGKLRMALEPLIPARQDDGDESLADFVTRRLGSEALEKIAEPLLSGIYSAEAGRQSILATFPRFRDLERTYGSLIRGMLAIRRAARAAASTTSSTNSERPPSAFVSFFGGTEELVTALVANHGNDITFRSPVHSISRTDSGNWAIAKKSGASVQARAIILAVPAYVAATLLADLAPRAANILDSIRYVSTATLSFGFRKRDISHPLDGFGVVIPHTERRDINAMTWTSTKFDHRAPADHVLIRTFMGGSRNPGIIHSDDDSLFATARRELKEILGIDTPPVLQRLYRWPDANPQYDVGHLHKVDAIEESLPVGIFVTGSPYRGIGIPDCVHQAEQTAEKVWNCTMSPHFDMDPAGA